MNRSEVISGQGNFMLVNIGNWLTIVNTAIVQQIVVIIENVNCLITHSLMIIGKYKYLSFTL